MFHLPVAYEEPAKRITVSTSINGRSVPFNDFRKNDYYGN